MVQCEMPKYYSPPEEIKDILKNYKVVAMVGLSDKPERPSFEVAAYLKSKGYKIIPVNPNVKEVLGERAYPSLKDVPDQVEIVDIFRKPEAVHEIVEQAIEKGAKVVWMQEGVINNEAAKRALDAGLKVVMNRCMLKEHSALYGSKN